MQIPPFTLERQFQEIGSDIEEAVIKVRPRILKKKKKKKERERKKERDRGGRQKERERDRKRGRETERERKKKKKKEKKQREIEGEGDRKRERERETKKDFYKWGETKSIFQWFLLYLVDFYINLSHIKDPGSRSGITYFY